MDAQQKIEEKCADLLSRLEGVVKWKWDDFHQALLADFSVDKKDQVWLVVKDHYSHCIDFHAMKSMAPELKHRARQFGQLEKAQVLFTNDLKSSESVMAAWWPWGHGATLSVRLFLPSTSEYIPPSGLLANIKRWFTN